MLSYLHSYHAGNHADVLKHFALFLVLDYYRKNYDDWLYLDTHSGAGLYDLNSPEALKNKEFLSGINILKNAQNGSPEIDTFLNHLQENCPDNFYWGSPFLAATMMLEKGRLRLFELHKNEQQKLQQNLQSFRLGRRLQTFCSDGLSALNSYLPPNPRRAIVLIDPPYEQKNEYKQVLNALKQARKRFAEGCYILWYPLLQKSEMLDFQREILREQHEKIIHIELEVQKKRFDGFGMHGSALMIVNPPYILKNQLATNLAIFQQILSA